MKIYFMRPPQPYGGPGSFQARLEKYLSNEGHDVLHHRGFTFRKCQLIVIFSSTKHLLFILYQKIVGAKIIVRLDNPSLKHRFAENIVLRNALYSEIDNLISIIIANFFADTVVFQSNYSRDLWSHFGVRGNVRSLVVPNGVDMNIFYPVVSISDHRTAKICVVEGEINDSVGIEVLNSVNLAVDVYGRISTKIREQVTNPCISFKGVVPRDQMPDVLRRYRVFLLLEINSCCPNSLVEALACGLIPVGFRTGSLPELLGDLDGFTCEYPGDSKRMKLEGIGELNYKIQNAVSASVVLHQYYRQLALRCFAIDDVGRKYEEIFLSFQ